MKIVLVVVVLAACSGSAQTPAQEPVLTNSVPRPPPDAAVDAPVAQGVAAIAKMTTFRDELCACLDKACADRVLAALTQWAQDEARKPRVEEEYTETDMRKIAELSDGFAKCMIRISKSGSGSGSPP